MMKSRLNLAISLAIKQQIETLQDEIGADSMTEVVRRAINVFDMIVKEQKQGNHLQVCRTGEKPVELHIV